MSFSSNVKKELCAQKHGCSFCIGASLYAMILFENDGKENTITFTTESREAADLFVLYTIELTGAILTIKEPDLRDRTHRPVYTVSVDHSDDVARLLSQFHLPGNEIFTSFFPKSLLCGRIFARRLSGVRYNVKSAQRVSLGIPRANATACRRIGCASFCMWFVLSYQFARRTADCLCEREQCNRGHADNEWAQRTSAMEMMNLKIEKELRNNANRIVNCETANIEKTVNASLSQIQKIKKIKDTIGLDGLPIPLQEAALLRLANPDATLSELCVLSNGSVSRSGMNHRLARLAKIADELSDE